MKAPNVIRRRRLVAPLAALFLIGGLAGLARLAEGHAGNNDPSVIHACVDNIKGDVRIVGVTGVCTVKEHALHWGIVGPAGQQGIPGMQGPPGEQGPAGTLANFEQLDGLGCTREGFPGVIELSYDAEGAAILKCAVNATPAQLVAAPPQLPLQVGHPPGTVTVTNDGQLSSGALTVVLTAEGGGAFLITGDTCTGQILTGGASCTIQVIVTFAGPQLAVGTLRVSASPGGVAAVALTGEPEL